MEWLGGRATRPFYVIMRTRAFLLLAIAGFSILYVSTDYDSDKIMPIGLGIMLIGILGTAWSYHNHKANRWLRWFRL